MVQVPAPMNDTVEPAIEHTEAEAGAMVKTTARPEVAVPVPARHRRAAVGARVHVQRGTGAAGPAHRALLAERGAIVRALVLALAALEPGAAVVVPVVAAGVALGEESRGEAQGQDERGEYGQTASHGESRLGCDP